MKEKTDQELKPKGNFYRSETRNLKCPSLPFFPMGPKEKVTSERKNSFMFQLGSGEIPILSIISITICGQNDTHTIWRVYNSVTIYSFKKKEIVWITHSLKKRQFVKFGECNKKVSWTLNLTGELYGGARIGWLHFKQTSLKDVNFRTTIPLREL